MKSKKDHSEMLILRLSNEKSVVIKKTDLNKIYLNNYLIKESNQSSIVMYNKDFSKEIVNDTTVEFNF